MIYCKKCGAKIDDDSDFCPECGAKQKDIVVKEVIRETPVVIKKGSGIGKTIIWAIIILIILAVIAGLVIFVTQQQAASQTHPFWEVR